MDKGVKEKLVRKIPDTIIYIRTSTIEQNPENQLKDCESINSFGEYELIEDKQSAWKDNVERDGFERLKKLIKSRKVNHLIVWDFDRLYRNRIKFKQFLEFLRMYKVKLHSSRQQWLEDLHKVPEPWNDIMYDLLINIYGHIAQDESDKKSKRVKAAVRKKDGITKSYKGNRWGRKSLSSKKVKMIRDLHKQKKNIRTISQELNISLGVVHKYISSEGI